MAKVYLKGKWSVVYMKKLINTIKIFFYQQPLYVFYYKHLPIKKNTVLIQLSSRETIGSHFFSFLTELEEHFPELEINFLTQESVGKTKQCLKEFNFNRVNVIRFHSKKYFKKLASSSYIITDNFLDSFFIKKCGQTYIHFSYETILCLFHDNSRITDKANIQRNFYMMDHVIISTPKYVEQLAECLGLKGIFKGTIIHPKTNDETIQSNVLSDYLFRNIQHDSFTVKQLCNGKETAIILGGAFWDNGVTTALLNTFDNIDLDARNYVVLLGQKQLKKEHEFKVRSLSNKIIFYPFPERLNAGLLDQFLYLAYMRFEWFDSRWVRKRIEATVRNDYKRIVGDLKVNHFVHFTGFGNRYSELIKHVPDEVNTVMYVHTDMVAEYQAKKNFSKKIIFTAYEQIDKVAVVHHNLKEGLINVVPAVGDKLYEMNNFLGEDRIRELAKVEMLETLIGLEMEHGDKDDFILDLNSEDLSVFINIGRFDYQKGHDRLIKAFEAVYKGNQNIRLVIVAPHGPLREKTLELVASSNARSGIYILGRMNNPYALLAKCNCFVLSSHYEGLGLVVYEALAVGISVVTVDLKETTEYLQNDEAIVVANSVDGLEKGMREYLLGQHPANEFDFLVPREKSRVEFEMLFDTEIG